MSMSQCLVPDQIQYTRFNRKLRYLMVPLYTRLYKPQSSCGSNGFVTEETNWWVTSMMPLNPNQNCFRLTIFGRNEPQYCHFPCKSHRIVEVHCYLLLSFIVRRQQIQDAISDTDQCSDRWA